jgi:uncharacterized protein
MKLVIIVLALVLLVWLLFGRGRSDGGRAQRPPRRGAAPPAVEGMVACAHCGLNLPASEALRSGALHYCSDSHRDSGPQAPPS